MEDFNWKEFQPYILLLIGLISLSIASFKKSLKANLKKTGQKAEGIIFAQEHATNDQSSFTEYSNIKDKISVRFLTLDNQWITGVINQEFASFTTNQYKDGEVVDVYYDQSNPKRFYVDTKQSEEKARLIFAAVGIIFSGIGLYQILSH